MTGLVPLLNFQPHRPAKHEVRFSRDVATQRLAFLIQELHLLPSDPWHPRENGKPNRVGA